MEDFEKGLSILTGSLETAITGIPAPVRKNFLKAIAQLCAAAVDLPVSWLEGKSAEIRASTDARIQIIKKEGIIISEQIVVPNEYISKASTKFAAKVIKEQLNLDQIVLNAANELTNIKQVSESSTEDEEISEDWLNEFENLARLKSSEDMKFVFGKILSGEITKPGTFSIRTVKLISQLDNEAAKLFQLLCSQTICLNSDGKIFDARVVSFDGNAASNSLAEFGLSFADLNILQEYGLIISDYNSYMPYSNCIANEQNQVGAILCYQNKNYGLVPIDREKFDNTLKLHGVALTKAGIELLSIIPMETMDNYTKALIEFFNSKHLELQEVK